MNEETAGTAFATAALFHCCDEGNQTRRVAAGGRKCRSESSAYDLSEQTHGCACTSRHFALFFFAQQS